MDMYGEGGTAADLTRMHEHMLTQRPTDLLRSPLSALQRGPTRRRYFPDLFLARLLQSLHPLGV